MRTDQKTQRTASGVKRVKQSKTGGNQMMERPVSTIGMAISPTLLEDNPDLYANSTGRTTKRGRPSSEAVSKRDAQRKIADKAMVDVTTRNASAQRVNVKQMYPQPIASGVKRGRKRNVVIEQHGWGIYNKKTSYLIDEFFKRKTDAINHLERDQKQPWSAIKHKDELKPVPVKIIILDKEIIGLAKAQKSML